MRGERQEWQHWRLARQQCSCWLAGRARASGLQTPRCACESPGSAAIQSPQYKIPDPFRWPAQGCFDIGLPSHKSLFQLHAEQIQRLQALATDAACEGSPAPELNSPSAAPAGKAECVRPIRWYIMTSAMTHTPTLAFFRAHTFFGLLESQVVFFQQGTLPCLSLTGSVVLASRTEVRTSDSSPSASKRGAGSTNRAAALQVARAPDGNGGLYRALQASGALADMRAHGVESVDCVCVDNALARSGDPTFLGACLSRGVDWGARVVSKASATERVGVFARCACPSAGGHVHGGFARMGL